MTLKPAEPVSALAAQLHSRADRLGLSPGQINYLQSRTEELTERELHSLLSRVSRRLAVSPEELIEELTRDQLLELLWTPAHG